MRKLDNWLISYADYVSETESAAIYHKWTPVSIIAASLRKKVLLSLGRINIYPNLYIVFVGEPGGPRKSQAITYGLKFLREIPDIVLSADAITPQALLMDLEECSRDEQMPSGEIFTHASLTITSKEFESFLGAKGENTKMITYLTDLYDAQEDPWKYRTKHSGNNTIPSVFLNLIAATTPDSIANSLPASAIGTGLTSRIIYIWAHDKTKKVTAPVETPEEVVLRNSLMHDLYIISRLAGTYNFSKDSFLKWDRWYQDYEALNPGRICKDPVFNAWYQRKPTFLLKVAMVQAAAESNDLVVEWRHIKSAIDLLEEMEDPMSNVFRAVGRSAVAADVDLVVNIIRTRQWIMEKQLMNLVWRDIDMIKFDNVINTAIKRGMVKRSYEGPKQEKGEIWYYFTGRSL